MKNIILRKYQPEDSAGASKGMGKQPGNKTVEGNIEKWISTEKTEGYQGISEYV